MVVVKCSAIVAMEQIREKTCADFTSFDPRIEVQSTMLIGKLSVIEWGVNALSDKKGARAPQHELTRTYR